jgi:hypothetical protein
MNNKGFRRLDLIINLDELAIAQGGRQNKWDWGLELR